MINSVPVTIAVAVCVLSLAVSGYAADYYIAVDGDDGAPGTHDQPWQTIGRANESLQPGDTVHIGPGTYTGAIEPVASGEPDAPITYRSSERLGAVLRTEGEAAIDLSDRSHIVIEGFEIRDVRRWAMINHCDHITVRDCLMYGADGNLQINHSEQCRLLDSVFKKDTVSGNMVSLLGCSYVLIEGNTFSRVGHCPVQLTNCRNLCVRANCFCNTWGRNWAFRSPAKILVEGNVITGSRDSGYSADSKAKNLYLDGICRFNRVFKNLHTPMNSGSYIPGSADPTGTYREPFRLMNSRLYNNTVTDNIGHGWELYGMNISANVLSNNCYFSNDWPAAGVQLVVGDEISLDNRLHNNLIAATEPGARTVKYRGEYLTTEEVNKRTGTRGNFWSEFRDNIDGKPAFEAPERNDYRLTEDSDCIDAGEPLTLAMGSGSGTVLPVADARYFYDGFGIEGEKGDWIAVGSPDTLARIQRVELRYYQPGLLHLDREVVWEDGMPVSLPWAGETTDIGAYERGLSHPRRVVALADASSIAPGQTVGFSLDPMGKKTESVRWDFGDGTRTTESEPSHTYTEPGRYGVIVRTENENGTRGIDVVFVEVSEPKGASTPLVEADFEDATRKTHWGWQFKFYRSWLTGYEQAPKPDGEGKCMHLWYTSKKACRAAGAVAPGAWDIDQYPIIRFQYRIPEGVPVAPAVELFDGPDLPEGFIFGGTPEHATDGWTDLGGCELIDDGQWHEAIIDLRAIHDGAPDIQYVRRFFFLCRWNQEGQEFWYDDFVIAPESE